MSSARGLTHVRTRRVLRRACGLVAANVRGAIECVVSHDVHSGPQDKECSARHPCLSSTLSPITTLRFWHTRSEPPIRACSLLPPCVPVRVRRAGRRRHRSGGASPARCLSNAMKSPRGPCSEFTAPRTRKPMTSTAARMPSISPVFDGLACRSGPQLLADNRGVQNFLGAERTAFHLGPHFSAYYRRAHR